MRKNAVSFLVFGLLVIGGFGVFSKLYSRILGGEVLGDSTKNYRRSTVTQVQTSDTVTPQSTVTQSPTVARDTVTQTPVVIRETETKYIYITVAPEKRETVKGTTQTLKIFLKSIGLPITPKVINIEPEKIEKTEEVITPREAGEILKELESVSGADKDNSQVRLRFKPRGSEGDTTLVAETQVGQDIALNDREVERIKATLTHGTDLKVTSTDDGFGFSKGVVNVETKLPLLLDLKNNTLTTEVSTGIKSVSILPDTAIDNALTATALDGVNSRDSVVMVEREDGKLAYRISGDVNRKLFGLFKTKTGKTVEVSAESGRILPMDKNLGDIILDWLAPKVN